jgi:hypothetical protein
VHTRTLPSHQREANGATDALAINLKKRERFGHALARLLHVRHDGGHEQACAMQPG